eukprot:COSAG05_NODE_102_length_19076_cov_21.766612_7_plen_91_part_00
MPLYLVAGVDGGRQLAEHTLQQRFVRPAPRAVLAQPFEQSLLRRQLEVNTQLALRVGLRKKPCTTEIYLSFKPHDVSRRVLFEVLVVNNM